ncbi:MAG: hypothetical protein ACJAVN_000014 [Roseivirga sp.]|jgi:hypothetical protein
MNSEESNAEKHFLNQGFQSIDFEPDGNIPPDFVLDKKIAVEVRRLNQNKVIEGKVIGTETLQNKFWQKLKTLVEKLNNQFRGVSNNESIVLSFSFDRPLTIHKQSIKQIEDLILQNYQNAEFEETKHLENLEIRFYKTEYKSGEQFIMGGYSDRDTGGFVVSNIYENLKLVIKEKEKKVSKFRERYDTWWLVLIDRIDGRLEEIDIKQLSNLPQIETYFDKVIMLTGRNHDIRVDIK